ncbi:MAG TPA: methyltransferase domain-containing protein, partial [Vicinamibacterales bacterium]|nr:methyltransferase domain-containing protein [Vicinamibacterales bacterium]
MAGLLLIAGAASAQAQPPQPQAPAQPPALRPPDVFYLPTPQPVVDGMLQLAKVTDKDVVYDLGCGDGRIPITAAQKYGARGVGIDIDPQRIKEANENAKAA